jgi:hypothetical protein
MKPQSVFRYRLSNGDIIDLVHFPNRSDVHRIVDGKPSHSIYSLTSVDAFVTYLGFVNISLELIEQRPVTEYER